MNKIRTMLVGLFFAAFSALAFSQAAQAHGGRSHYQPPRTVVIQNGYVISECHHNCFHRGHPSQYRGRHHGHRQGHHHGHRQGHHRGHRNHRGYHRGPRSSVQFGINVHDGYGSSFGFGFSQRR